MFLLSLLHQTDWSQSQGFWLFSLRVERVVFQFIFIFKGNKKGKWLNAILFTGDMFFSEQKGLWSVKTFRLSSPDLLLGTHLAAGSPLPL